MASRNNTKQNELQATSLLLIGAGLPRTGTTSLRDALQQLLRGECYHFYALEEDIDRGNMDQFDFWKGIQDGKVDCNEASFRDFVRKTNIVAGVDHPFSQYYETLMRAFPDAKVLLSVRDPESWYKSMKRTLMVCMIDLRCKFPHSWYTYVRGHMPYLNLEWGVNPRMFKAVEDGKETAITFYNDWVKKVKNTVPEDRLLVFSVKEGWKPLCDFLDVPVPANDFPFLNDTKAQIQKYDSYKRTAWCILVFVMAAAVILAAALIQAIFM